jgi:hypothetical protein
MEPLDNPPELSEIERRLAQRRQPRPSAAFRERVLAAMQQARAPKRTAWQSAAVAAAALLLICNLALSLANHLAWSKTQRIEGGIEATARTLRQRHPDLSEQEAYQLALVLHSPPALPLSPPTWSLEGEPSWDMR